MKKNSPGLKRTNARPEKQVEKACMVLMKAMGWDMQVYESKAKNINGRWVVSGMKAGTCDCQGTTDFGIGAFVEFKAPGQRASFNRPKNYKQREYIVSKINCNAFACVVDSAELLKETYDAWLSLRAVNLESAKLYLLNVLPQKKPQGF